MGICNTNQDRVRPTIRSDDLQNARSSGYMYRQSCVTPTAYQTFMCPEIVQSFERLYGRNETEAFQYSVRNPLLSLAVVTFTAITQTVPRVWGGVGVGGERRRNVMQSEGSVSKSLPVDLPVSSVCDQTAV